MVAISTKSITLVRDGVLPPALVIARVDDAAAAVSLTPLVASPKSMKLPNVAIVQKSIVLIPAAGEGVLV